MQEQTQFHNQMNSRDRAISVVAKNGNFRAVAIKTNILSNIAQSKHNLKKLEAEILGEFLTAALLLAAFLKGEERIIITAKGNNIVKKITAEAMQNGEVRGYISIDENKINDDTKFNKNLDVLLGNGILSISKVLYDANEPITGIVEIINGTLEQNLIHYFAQSEQVDTLVNIRVSTDEDGIINNGGGYIVQALPGVDSLEIFATFEYIKESKVSPNEYYMQGKRPDQMFKEILPFEFNISKSTQVDFFCRCSKDKLINALITLGYKEIKELEKNGNDTITCAYCNNEYILEKDDFNKLIEETQARLN